MLYRLEIENFFSIRDRQVLDLTIDAKVPDPDGRFAPIFEGSDLRAPKVVAIYGANASGKTNVLRALEVIVWIARDSVNNLKAGFDQILCFADHRSGNQLVKLAVEIGGLVNFSPDLLKDGNTTSNFVFGQYRYELELSTSNGVATEITFEALRQKPQGAGKWQRIFERDTTGSVNGSRFFSLSGFQHLEKTLARNHSVISSFSKFKHPSAEFFYDTLRRALFHVDPVHATPDGNVINYLRGEPALLSRLNSELSRIDVGVKGLSFENTTDGPQARFRHFGLDFEMPWYLESQGTRAFIKLYPFLASALEMGGLVAVDEMDAAIHPNLLPELLRWFYSTSGRNRGNAQLWLACHSASLLDDLNKEEIVICEKDRQGRTSFFSLMDVKVRRDENHYRKYLSGAYGGVPQLG